MKADLFAISAIGTTWLLYFILHSVLASNNIKDKFSLHFSDIAPCYRLFYNIIAIAGLIPILILLSLFQGPMLIEWSPAFSWLKTSLIVSAVMGFVWSLRYYDLSEFSGLNQCRIKSSHEIKFIISPLHRYVRHPWYFFALIVIWSRDMDLMQLISAVLMSGYFVMGSRLEERKLCQAHGEVYKDYTNNVPALLPRPWKKLTKEDADELMKRH